jgi:hypothetical protein
VLHQRDVGARLRPAGQFLDARQQEGRDRLAGHALLPASRSAWAVMRSISSRGIACFGRHRIADHHAALQAELPLGADEARLLGRVSSWKSALKPLSRVKKAGSRPGRR